MRVVFDSSHVTGNFSSGRLLVRIGTEDPARGQTVWDEIFFIVPDDFHTHNDAVAAALMTLVGRRYAEVEFNFPISPFCAETLRAYYGDIALGPIDPSASPRRPGQRVALNFSGGTDSVVNWLLLREIYGDEFLVVTSEYGEANQYDEPGYRPYHRDVSCRTNLRRKGYDQSGRFHFCVPLLFADYVDLGGIITGHNMAHSPDGIADYRSVARPDFLKGDLVVNAGGVEDIHLLRSLTTIGVAKLIMALGPERIADALAGSAPVGSSKRFLNAAIFRHLFQDAGLPLPRAIDPLPPLRVPMRRFEHALRLLYIFRRDGWERVCAICPHFARLDRDVLSRLSFDFLGRYHPRFIELLDEPLRTSVVQIFESNGVGPYDERDWEELATVRRLFKATFPRYANLDD